jgi:hypothetical protein
MICLNYKIKIQDKDVNQKIIASSNSVFIQSGEKEVVYLKEKNGIFTINRTEKTLVAIDMSTLLTQMEKIRSQLGNIVVEKEEKGVEFSGYSSRKIVLKNDTDSPFYFQSELIISELNEIQKTAYFSYTEYESETKFYRLHMAANEVITFNNTQIRLPNGIVQMQSAELIYIANADFDMADFETYQVI